MLAKTQKNLNGLELKLKSQTNKKNIQHLMKSEQTVEKMQK